MEAGEPEEDIPVDDVETGEPEEAKEKQGKHKVIACDFDGTLSNYTTYRGVGVYGDPIIPMVDRLKGHISDGDEVVIFTARARNPKEVELIKQWCKDVFDKDLEVTDKKSPMFDVMYDDRAVRIEKNTGRIL